MPLHGAVKGKPELCWKTQGVGDVRAVVYLLRRVVYKEWNESRWEKCVSGTKVGRTRQSNSLTSDIVLQNLECAQMNFGLALVQHFLTTPSLLHFKTVMYIFCVTVC